ncbi:MAG: hypothetical protein LBQ66_09230 [Planctomycetaceae bacterium]|nr:hypothetical protein [Planctomycetaceae bacterium]
MGDRNADAFSAPTVGEYADATARWSVAYLTITNLRSPMLFPHHFVWGKPPSLTLCECIYDLCITRLPTLRCRYFLAFL